MNKLLTVGATTLFICLAFTPEITADETNFGNTLYVGGTGSGNHSKIQDAVDNAANGDTVFVYSGTYYENVVVDKSIDLIGEDRENTIINGMGDGIRQKPTVYINVDWVNISGFTVKKSKSYGIDVHDGNNIHIKNNKVISNDYDGIRLYRSNESNITRNIINDNGLGGMSCQVLVKSFIYENNIIGNDVTGIKLVSSSDNEISRNLIRDNGYDGIDLFNSYRNNISFNNIISCEIGIGIIRSSFDNTIIFNDLEYNDLGILISDGSADNSILFNNIKHNDLGISIIEESVGTSIIKNNLIDNICNAYFEITFLKTFLTKIIKSKRIEIMNWDMNYWDDNFSTPEIISGKIFLEWNPIDIYKPPQKRFIMKVVDFDWFPANKPYDIPAGGA
jgi:parallel beta-helix repeat protein